MAELDPNQANAPVPGVPPVQNNMGIDTNIPDPAFDESMDDITVDDVTDVHFNFPLGTLSPANDMVNNWKATAQVINNIPLGYAPGVNKELLGPIPGEKQTKLENIAEVRRRDFQNMLKSSQNHEPSSGIGASPKAIHFSTKGFDADKWEGSYDFNEIGFHPFRDNERLYTESETFWDENSRMWDNYDKLFWPAFTSHWRAAGDMLSGEETYLSGDYQGAIAFHDAMRKGGSDSFINNTILQTAFTMGIISSIAAEELVIAGVTALAPQTAPIGAVKTGMNIAKVANMPRYLSRVFNNFGLTRAASGSVSLIKSLRKAENAKDYWNAGLRFSAHMIAPETAAAYSALNTTKNVANGIQGFGKGAQYFGAFYRDMRAINLAVAESKLEGGMVYNELVDSLYLQERVKANGGDPSMKRLESVYKNAKEAEFQTVLYNAPVIFLTNKLVIGTALKGFKGLAAATAAAAQGMGRKVLTFAGAKTGAEAIKKGSKWWLPRVMARGFKGNMQQILGAGLLYGKANLGEGFQELYQEGLAVAMKDYYTNLHNDPIVGGWDAIKSNAEWSKSKGEGVDAMMTEQGAEIFASGFVMGGMVQLPQHIMFKTVPSTFHRITNNAEWKANKEAQEKNLDIAVKHLQDMYDDNINGIGKYFDISKLNSAQQKHLSEIMLESDHRGSALDSYDAQDASIYSHLNSLHQTGKGEFFKSQFQDFLGLDDKGLSEAFPEEVTQDGITKVRDRLTKAIERVDETKQQWKDLNQELINPWDKNKYTPGTEEYMFEYVNEVAYNQYKMMLMFNKQMFKRAVERYNSIFTDLIKSGVSKNIGSIDIEVLTNVGDLVKEMAVLDLELQMARTTQDVEVEVKTTKTGTTKKEETTTKDSIEKERAAELDEYYEVEEEGAMVANPEYGPVAEQIGQSWLMQKDKELALKYYEALMKLDMTHQERHDKMLAWMEKKNFNMRKPLQYIENEVDRINAKYDAQIKKLEETVTEEKVDEVETTEPQTKIKSGETITEDEAMLQMSEEQRESYLDRQERLSLLTDVFKVLTDPENIVKKTESKDVINRIKNKVNNDDSFAEGAEKNQEIASRILNYEIRSVEKTYGFFDRRKTPKLKPSVQAYIEYLSRQEGGGGIVDMTKFDDFMKGIMDYKALNGRSIELNKAINYMINPNHAVEMHDRMAVGMLKAYRENRDQIETRLKNWVATSQVNVFLNDLANQAIYPEDSEMVAFLKDPVNNIPTTYRIESGILTKQTDALKYSQLNTIRINFKESLESLFEKEEAAADKIEKETDSKIVNEEVKSFAEFVKDDTITDPEQATQDKLDERIKEAEDMQDGVDNNRLRIPTFVKTVLNRRHANYVATWKLSDTTEDYMEMDQWREQPKIRSIYKALTEIYKIYALERSTEEFGTWLENNRTSPQIRKIYYSQFALTYSDIAVNEPEGFHKDKLDRGARETITQGKGVNIVRKTIIDDNGEERFLYDITDDYKESLIKEPIEGEDGLKTAQDKQRALIAKSKEGGSFEFEGEAYKHNEVVEDKENNSWVIISKRESFNGNDLYLTPIQDLKKKTKRKKIVTAGNFKSKGWTRSSDQSVDKGEQQEVSRLRQEEALYISSTKLQKKDTNGYYKGDANLEDVETKQEADERQQTMLRNLTPQEVADITLKISHGPKWASTLSQDVKDKKVAKNFGIEYRSNESILQNAQEFSVEIFNGDVSLGYLNGPSQLVLLDSAGAVIHPEIITEAQVFKLFRTYGNDSIKKTTRDIRNYYIQAYYLYENFQKTLEGKSEESVEEIKLSDLDYININISRGNEAFVEKGTKGVKFEDLDYKFIDGESIYWILQYRRDYSVTSGGKIKTLDRSITNVKKSQRRMYEDIVDDLIRSRGNQLKKLGAYVAVIQLPNGSYSLVEVKAPTMSDEKANNVVSSIKKQVEKTLDENVKTTDDNKSKPKLTSFNHEFNDNLNEELFIANDVGTDVRLSVTPYGELEITLYNKKAFEKKDGKVAIFERKKLVKGPELDEIKTARDLINYINKLSTDSKSYAKTQNDTALIKQADKIKLNLTVNAFKESIPDKGISSRKILTEYLLPAETSYEAKLRKNIKLLMSATDSAGLDEMAYRLSTMRKITTKGKASAIIEDAEVISEVEDTSLAEVTPEVVANAYENPELIPESVIQNIATKMLAGEGLTSAEINLYENIANDRVNNALGEAEKVETNNESIKSVYLEKVNKAKQDAEDYYNIKTLEITAALVSQGQTSAQAKGAAYLAVMNDPVYLSLVEKYEDLNTNSALAVIPGVWDNYDVEKIDDFIEWGKESLPEQLYIRDTYTQNLDALGIKLKDAHYKAGRFLMHGQTVLGINSPGQGLDNLVGEISVGTYNPLKYHEAFHGVFRMLLTDEEIQFYMNLAKKEVRAGMRNGGIKLTHGVVVKNMNDALKEMRKVHPKYAEMTNAQLEEVIYEEYLANQFDKFKMRPGSVSNETRSLFQKIIDFLKQLLGFTKEKSIVDLFQEIDSGMFRSKATQNNMFTRSLNSSPAFAILNIPTGMVTTPSTDTRTGEERVMNVTSYIPADQSQKMVFTIGNLFMDRREKSSIADAALLDNTISDVIDMYNITSRIEFYQGQEGFLQFAPGLQKYFEALDKNRDVIKNAVSDYIGAFAVSETENDLEDTDEAQEHGLRSVSEYSKDQTMVGGWSKLNQWVRQYIGLTIMEEVDQFGNEFINPEAPVHLRERVASPVNFMFVYRGILKAVKNSRNDQELIKKMVMFSRSDNKHTKAFVDKFLTDIGLTEAQVLADDWQLTPNVKDAVKFQRVVNAFRLYRTTNAIVHRDTKAGKESGIYYMYEANRQDDEHSQTKVWAARFIQKSPELLKDSELQREVFRALDDLIDLLEETSIADRLTTEQLSKIKNYDVSKDDSLEGRATYISSVLNEALGMSLRAEYIKYSVTNNIAEVDRTNQQQALYTLNSYIEPVDTEAIREIKIALTKGEHLYRDYQELFDEESGESLGFEKGGVKGRVRKLAANNAQFDESVGESTYNAADNNKIYGHQMPTLHLEKIAEMQGDEWIQKIQDDEAFTYDSLIQDEKFLEAVRRGEIRHVRLSGHKLAPLGMDTGEFELGGGDGVSYGDLSMKDFIKNMLAMATYTYDKSSPLKKTPIFETKDGQKFAMSPVPIKILSDASTLDMVIMPINHMVEQSDEGEIELTQEGTDLFIAEIEGEYARIQKENNPETRDQRTIEGFNNGQMRGLQLFATGNLMNVRDGDIKSTVRVEAPSLADVTIDGILEGKQRITLLSKAQSGRVRIGVGNTSVVALTKRDKPGGEFVAVTNKGLVNVKDVDLARIIEELGPMVYKTRPEAKGKKEPLSFTYRKKKYYTFSWNLIHFVNGRDFYVLGYNTNIEGESNIIDPLAEYNITERTVQELTELRDDAVEREEYELAQQLTDELNNRSKPAAPAVSVENFEIINKEFTTEDSLFPTATNKQLGEEMRALYDSGVPVKLAINNIDPNNISLGSPIQDADVDMVAFTLSVDGNNIGSLAVNAETNVAKDETNEIVNVEILPEFRGLGLGTKLYKAAAAELGGLKSDPSFLSTKAENIWKSLVKQGLAVKTNVKAKGTNAGYAMIDPVAQLAPVENTYQKKLYTLDTAVKEEMEKRALEGMSWEDALKTPITYTDAKNKKVTTTLEERVNQKQMQEFGDFINMLYETNIMSSLPIDVREGLIDVDTNSKGGVTYTTNQETELLEEYYNIKHGNKEYNIAQLFLNNAINARRFAHYTTGDPAMSFTDMFVNLTKRAKGEHGGGTNFATDIIAPELGIFHKNKDINLLTIKDPKFQNIYSDIFGTGDLGSPGKTADAFAVMTTKAALHTAFGDGRLSVGQADYLRRIANGDVLSSSEVFGDSRLQGGLILPIGIPGSGKSTWINKLRSQGQGVLVVSPDNIRAQLSEVSDQSQNALVFKIAHEEAAKGIADGKLVVFDATNTMQDGPFGRKALIEKLKELSGKEFTTYYEMFDVDLATVKERIKKDIAEGKKRANVPEAVIDRMHNQFIESKNRLEGMVKFDIKRVQNRGLKKLDAFLNSKKFMYADGTTYLKMSVGTLIPELTSVKINGEWVARTGREEWHNLRLKMEAAEKDTETFTIAAFETASKAAKINVVSEKDAFGTTDVTDMFTTIEAKYLRRQMINPSNKMEIVDAVQMKQKLPSEQIEGKTVIINGKPYSVGEVMEKYHNTISSRLSNKFFRRRNLIFTLESALNEFATSKEIGKATVNLKAFVDYAQNALEASQAKVQMLDLFESENGAPKYNLNNPITEKQFEKLFLTFFSKGVLSERIPGTSLALMPEYGLRPIKKVLELDEETGQPIRWDVIRSDDWETNYRPKGVEIQHKEFTDKNAETFAKGSMKVGDYYLDVLRHDVIIYDENGKATDIRGSEFMMPPHFKSVMDHIKPGDKIPDVIAKAFGIRIPSQDDHSAVNLIMVDFLPAVMGSTAAFSKRLIEISGADFDIDKLYTQLKEFYVQKGVFKEYGRGQNRRQQYSDYIRNTISEYGNKKSDVFMATEVWADRGDFVSAVTERTVTTFNKENGTEYTVEEILESDRNVSAFILHEIIDVGDPLTDQQVLKLWKKNEDIQGGLWMLGLPSTLKEYNQYRDKFGREPYDAALNNEALDIKYALLGNPGKTEVGEGGFVAPAYQSAVVTPLEVAWEFFESQMPELAEERKAQEYDPYNLLGQAVAFNSNKEFSRGIGSIVAPNLPLNVLSENNIILKKEAVPYELNDHKYTKFVKKYAIDPKTGEEDVKQYRKQFAISALISGIVDNANEQLAQKLGITQQSLPVLGTLIAMGVDMNTAILIINHPAINLIYEELASKGRMEAGFDKRLNDRIIYIEKTVLKRKANEKETKELPQVTTEEMVKFINETKINRTQGSTKAGYVKEPKGSKFEVLTNDQALFDLAVLTEFQKAKRDTDFVRNVGVMLNIAKGTGQDTAAIEDSIDAAAELGLELNDKDFSKTDIQFDVRKVFNNKSKKFQATYWNILKEINYGILPKILLNRTNPFLKLRESLIGNLDSKKFSSEERRILSSEITSYLSGKAYIQWLKFDDTHADQVASLSNGFIYDALGEKFTVISVVDRVRKYLTSQGKQNYFINEHIVAIDTKHEDNRQGFSRLITSNWTEFTDAELSSLQSSMLELYADVNTRQDLMHIINYLTVKDGLRFNSESFINIVPATLLQNQLNVVTDVHKLFLDTNPSDTLYNRVFGATYKELQYELIEGFTDGVNSSKFIVQINSNKVDQTFVVDAEEATIPDSTININYFGEEGDANTKLLSNLAKRKFSYKFLGVTKEYSSVEQAFQSLRTGSFDKKTYDKYNKSDGGKLILGGETSSVSEIDPIALMTELVVSSLEQNYLNTNLIDALMSHSDFTISQGLTLVDRAMIQGLRIAQKQFVVNKETGRYVTRGYVKDMAKATSQSINNRAIERLDEGTLRINAIKGLKSMFGTDRLLTGKQKTALEKTKKVLKELGITYETANKKGKPRIIVTFPYAITIIEEDVRGNREYRNYKMDGMVKVGADSVSVDMFDMMDDNGLFKGVIGEYSLFEKLGSRQQKGPAYLYGARPSYTQLRDNEQDKTEGWDDLLLGIDDNAYDGLEDMFDPTRRTGEDKAFGETDDVTATDKGYTTLERGDLLEDYDQTTGRTIGGDVDSTLDMNDTTEEDYNLDARRFVDLEAILNKSKETEQTDDSDRYPMINEYWDSLTSTQRLKLMDALNISSINELFTIFEDQNNLDNEKQFIDRLKSCY